MAQLRKIINLGVVPEEHIASYNVYVERCRHKAYFIDYEYIGCYGSKEEAEGVFYAYNETDPRVIAYEIIGDNHFDTETVDCSEYEIDIEVDSETPEFYLVFDANKKLISSFFYDTENPGGERLEGEHIYEPYEIAWVRGEYADFTLDYEKPTTTHTSWHYVLLPVKIAGKPSLDFLAVYRSGIDLAQRAAIGDLWDTPKSLTKVREEIKNDLNDGLDTLIYSPLLWLKGSHCIYPRASHIDEACRYEFLPADIIAEKS